MTDTREILRDLASGKITIDDAEKQLKIMALAEIGGVGNIDLNRQYRSGIPEVVYAESKNIESLVRITQVLLERNRVALLTRVSKEKADELEKALLDCKFSVKGNGNHLTVLAHTLDWTPPSQSGKIAIITAGTSDIQYAAEAEDVALLMGVEAMTFYDIGVAGIHRLIEPVRKIIENEVDALVVFAGMEGALPTLMASLVDIPVIGVPVPTGYGHGGAGETALASMLQSCAPGLSVVNIGNGLGAGAFACLIAKRCARKAE